MLVNRLSAARGRAIWEFAAANGLHRRMKEARHLVDAGLLGMNQVCTSMRFDLISSLFGTTIFKTPFSK